MKEDKDLDKVLSRLDDRFERFLIRMKDSDDFKTYDEVFDKRTLLAIHTMMGRDWLKTVEHPISTGKEANVFKCTAEHGLRALKILRMNTAMVRRFAEYIQGDPRFKAPLRSKTELLFTWARKEYQNLTLLRDAGVRVPEPLHFFRNMIVMEFLGDEDSLAAPRLKDVPMDREWAQETYEEVVRMYRLSVSTAKLVHADLSEYNILVHGGRPWIIDVSQSVRLEHPEAPEYLKRDIRNIAHHFKRRGVSIDSEELESSMIAVLKEASK